MLNIIKYTFKSKNLSSDLANFYRYNRKAIAQIGKENGFKIGASNKGTFAKQYPTIDCYRYESDYITWPDKGYNYKGSVIIPNDFSNPKEVLDIIRKGIGQIRNHYQK